MISYNKTALNEVFNSLSVLLNANVSLLDENYETAPVANFGNKSVICNSLNKYIQKLCSTSDAGALKKCANSKQPFVYQCHFGFSEIIIPFSINNVTSFFVILGPFKKENSSETIKNNILQICEKNNLDPNDYISHLSDSTTLNDEYIKSIINIVSLLINNAITNKHILIKDNFVENKLNPFLLENISKKIYIGDIAKQFFYSPKQLENAIKEYSGMGPRKYILKFKINVAKEMLVSTTKNLQQIASEVGFDDYNYFIKVFKIYSGETPLHYRKKFNLNTF